MLIFYQSEIFQFFDASKYCNFRWRSSVAFFDKLCLKNLPENYCLHWMMFYSGWSPYTDHFSSKQTSHVLSVRLLSCLPFDNQYQRFTGKFDLVSLFICLSLTSGLNWLFRDGNRTWKMAPIGFVRVYFFNWSSVWIAVSYSFTACNYSQRKACYPKVKESCFEHVSWH